MSVALFFVALALVHAQQQPSTVNVTELSQLTANVLAPNTEFRLQSTLTVNSSITITGAANSVISCSLLPCFVISVNASNSEVRFANVIVRFTAPEVVSQGCSL
jgi:sulfite exporter TauE/SafE